MDALRKAYLEAVERLIQRYPVQEQNRGHYEGWARSARLGRTTRRIRTKGGFTDIPRGELVLMREDQLPRSPLVGAWEVWAPRPDGDCVRTVVGANEVRAECETCEGSRLVRPHPTALVAIACPSC